MLIILTRPRTNTPPSKIERKSEPPPQARYANSVGYMYRDNPFIRCSFYFRCFLISGLRYSLASWAHVNCLKKKWHQRAEWAVAAPHRKRQTVWR